MTTLTAVAASAVLVGGGLPGTPAADAAPTPLDPRDPTVAEQWVNPLVRPGEADSDVRLELVAAPDIEGRELSPGQDLRVRLVVHNDSDEPVSGLSVLTQRSNPAPTVAQARHVLSLDRSSYPFYGRAVELNGPIAPGESRELNVTVPTAPGEEDTLGITAGGVYPVLFSLSGVRGTADGEDSGAATNPGPVENFTTERVLVPVADAESSGGGAVVDDATTPDAAPAEQAPGLTLLYPLTAPVDIVPGETGEAPENPPLLLRSEQLAEQLAPGGRLEQLLASYQEALAGPGGEELAQGSCLALDPALVDTVDRMSRGYTVGEERPSLSRQGQRLRDSWTSNSEPDPGVPGTGAEDATEWLAELRETAAEGCTVALPWANADLGAVAETGDQWLFREAVERGPTTLTDVLGATPETNIIIPGDGYITETAAPALGWADQSTSTVAEGGMQQAWEAAAAARAQQAHRDTDSGSTLDSTELPALEATGPAPATPVHVLVAANTVWQAPQVDRFATLSPGITAVTYQDSLAATLATTGPAPQTVGYSNPASRFDYRADSDFARSVTAGAAVRLAAGEQTIPGGQADSPDPLLVMPPAQLAPQAAETLLDTVTQLLADDRAQPLPLRDYVTPTPEQSAELAAQPAAPAQPGVTRFGTPYPDPAQVSDAEVLRAGQQARYIDDLTRMTVNEPIIALTRYGFTLPLRRDLLTSLTVTDRRALATHNEAVERTNRILDGNRRALQDLRESVSLIPPGNVYTRASESSPLLIVAENGLPLPVDAQLAYSGPEGARLNLPGLVRIPARGSITVQMTADLPPGNERTDLTLWLATPDGSTISSPVDISVQTRAGTVGAYGIGLLVVVFLALALLFRVGRNRRRRDAEHPGGQDRPRDRPQTQSPGGSTAARARRGRPARRTPRRGGGRAGDATGSPKPPGGTPDP
ncbi:hypothetical protein [Corynebacterium halotolerans]|uniref:hypothetical protein n=1 Tax=Corynebacterium halotolerans TaxID=225326 RepID=UPI0003452693|nr:hypothetical protein [Corynebacterium halotolerans]